MMDWNEFIGVTSLLYALANPIGVIPIFLGLTKQSKNLNTARIVLVAALSVTAFLIIAILIGTPTLEFFNVGLDDFRIAGGLLALFIAFEMFRAHYGGFMQTIDEHDEAEADIHGITPLAFPLLIGPAELGVMITLTNDSPQWSSKLGLIASSVVTGVLIAVTLWLALPINRLMGRTGINVATRVMALIVAAIGVNFIMTGIKNHLPGLVG
jgi:multiple antibiotic resistance protein